MAKKVNIKSVCSYNGHNIKANKAIDIGFKFAYSELARCIQLIQLLNENVKIAIKIAGNQPIKLGMFMIKDFRIDNDGECTVKFTSSLDFVEASNLNNLAGEVLQISFVSNVEVKAEEEDEA